ncbi:MAG TPA: DUF420 domain-containing protein [Terriglobales bacterium]|nr:DUF420 domain-containing protein [Terriglobales bacterium]
MSWASLPAWIAILNGLSAVLLGLGYYCIRRRNIAAHRRCMIAAFAVSTVFLVVYVAHHLHTGVVYYHGLGWHRWLYFALLSTHTPLAAVVPVLAVIVLTLALRRRFSRHRAWARWTWPVWMYVSLSGIGVYWMLYHG